MNYQTPQYKFEVYEIVRRSGITNMLDVPAVMKYSREVLGVMLTKKEVLEMMENYEALKEKYACDQL